VQRFMEVLCLLSRGSWRSPHALGGGPGVIRMFFFVLVGIVIPPFFLGIRSKLLFLGYIQANFGIYL
jgi:hypothetical protein